MLVKMNSGSPLDTRARTIGVPICWRVPGEWPGVLKLGPWIDGECTERYDPGQHAKILVDGAWQLEVGSERRQIPGDLHRMLADWRPTPLREAKTLCRSLGIRSTILFKDETASPVHSYKANAALAQAWFAKQEGIQELIAFTLSGYWGVAVAWACAQFGIRATIMAPQALLASRKQLLEQVHRWGGVIEASEVRPSLDLLVERRARFAVGCFLNSVVGFNSVIGQESKEQLASMSVVPDAIVGCCGGGTNFGGMVLPFLLDHPVGGDVAAPEFVAVEPDHAHKLGHRDIKPVRTFGSQGPLYRSLTTCLPDAKGIKSSEETWAPGLSYPVTTPLLVELASRGRLTSLTCSLREAKSAAALFEECEHIAPAPESAYAIWGALEIARRLDAADRPGAILFGLTGARPAD